MRLMPKDLKTKGGHAPLSVAKERVRDSWKVLKQSIYSLNSKAKSYDDTNGIKDLIFEGENSQGGELKLKDGQNITVDTLIGENVKSFLNDSDDIGELLDKYRYELFAFNRLKSKLLHGDAASEFSELSSISELSTSSESECDNQTIISETFDVDYHHPLKSKSCSTSSSTLSANVSPYPNKTLKYREDKNLPPPERATAVLKPLPIVMKPYYIPNVNDLDDGDIENVVKAQANSSKGSGINLSKYPSKNVETCSVENRQNSIETRKFVNNAKSTLNKDFVDSKIDIIDSKTVFASTPIVVDNSVNKVIADHSFSLFSRNLDNIPCNTANRNQTDKKGGELFGQGVQFPRPRNASQPDISGPFKHDEQNTATCRRQRSCESVTKPTSISQSTMAKYPHIFSNYLSFQHDPFHSLPNLNAKQDTLSDSQSSADCKETDVINNVRMIDENYFVIYPAMSETKIKCGNPPCSKVQVTAEINRLKFTSCPSCYICYCSRTCRHCHWPIHKETCVVGFANFFVHTFFRRCEKDFHINGYLRKLAYSAYQIFGRGCLTITYKSLSDIEFDAISPGLDLSTQATYKEFKTILNENNTHRHLHMLCQRIKDYDPDQEFVLNIFVCIGDLNPDKGENIHTTVVRSARISTIKSEKPSSILSYGIRTFSLPTAYHVETDTDVETRRYYCKEIAFGLKRYGVHLKSEYPEAYEKLYRYIDEEVLFTPIILYGKRNNRNFKCILYSGEVKKSNEYYGEGVFV